MLVKSNNMSTFRSSYPLLVLLVLTYISSSLAQELPFLIFNGKVQNDLSEPIPGAQVQFWQTDTEGNYNHPFAAGVQLDPTFQYYGTATTDDNGDFQFLTRRPGIYPSRPVTHIHFKVWLDGADIFTSQFYFRDENTSFNEMLILDLVEATDIVGNGAIPTFSTNKTIILNRGLGGSGPFTPSQGAGPFYPTQDFFNLGSIMINITADEQPGTPVPSVAPVIALPMTTGPSSLPGPNGVTSSAPSVTTNTTDEPSAAPVVPPQTSAPSNPPEQNDVASSAPSITAIAANESSPPSSAADDSSPASSPNTSPQSKDSSANQPAITIVVAVVGLVALIF